MAALSSSNTAPSRRLEAVLPQARVWLSIEGRSWEATARAACCEVMAFRCTDVGSHPVELLPSEDHAAVFRSEGNHALQQNRSVFGRRCSRRECSVRLCDNGYSRGRLGKQSRSSSLFAASASAAHWEHGALKQSGLGTAEWPGPSRPGGGALRPRFMAQACAATTPGSGVLLRPHPRRATKPSLDSPNAVIGSRFECRSEERCLAHRPRARQTR